MEKNESFEIRSDLLLLVSIVGIFAIFLAGLKIYDLKTGEISKIGRKILTHYLGK